jgi:hypothetical protein
MDRELERLEQLQSWIEMMDRLLSGEAWEHYEKAAAEKRMHVGRPKEGVERFPQDNSRKRDAIAERIGVSGRTYEKYEQRPARCNCG